MSVPHEFACSASGQDAASLNCFETERGVDEGWKSARDLVCYLRQQQSAVSVSPSRVVQRGLFVWRWAVAYYFPPRFSEPCGVFRTPALL